ncbi:hypothetical protein ACCY16_17510 [Candidatus Pantoea formicae]|uniref:hypothetical protein n=1 Tax=Candidatus Pantoea formicae TaxID=2608355 RepID=UPI003ED95B21
MDVIEQIAAMAEGTERPALIWGNTDRATVAAEALWVFSRRTGLDGWGDEAYTAVQDLIANLMHLCEQEGITGGEVTFASMVNSAEMHYLGGHLTVIARGRIWPCCCLQVRRKAGGPAGLEVNGADAPASPLRRFKGVFFSIHYRQQLLSSVVI